MSLFTTDHRILGRRYLCLSLLAIAIGTLQSLVMRIHLVWPEFVFPLWGVVKPEDYLALVTMHGTLMLFFVLTLAPQAGFGSLVLPAQIGARRMAFPALNAAAFWLFALALAVLFSASLVAGGGPIGGWTAYPPLSAIAAAGPGQGLGLDIWLASLTLFSIASILSAVNLLATIIAGRCQGMTWERLPLTVWSWFTAALLTIIAFSVLMLAVLLLLSDRHAATSFFLPEGLLVNGTMHHVAGGAGGGSPLLWLHLFWFFGHPEVYIAILPGMGLTSMVLANFSRRRVFGYRVMIATTLLIGFLGILVWGHHMFVAGMNPFAGTAFSISTMAIALPSAAKVFSWLTTIWRSRPRMQTPMLYALGFVSFFIAGGLTGPILAQPVLDQYLNNTYFVVAHFHLIMAMAGVFGLFAATAYWFPLLTSAHGGPARQMNETLGRWHFWLTLVGAYAVFLPMHLAGLAGSPRHYAELAGVQNAASKLLAGVWPVQHFVTLAAFVLASAQMLFLANVAISLRRGKVTGENPWLATTLEWASPPGDQSASNQQIRVYGAPCRYIHKDGCEDCVPQWVAEQNQE